MAVENAPWAVDGAKHSGAVSRTLAYASTNGAEGVIGPGDLAVLATQTPSNQVRVMPGGAAIRNRAASGGQQTYTARNVSQTLVTVEPTSSSGGRTDYVWAHIVDPEYSGQVPENPLDAQYFFLTSSPAQPPGNGWYRLARIDIPANTATITQAMITDLRQVANPRSETVMVTRPMIGNWMNPPRNVQLRHVMGENGMRGEIFPDVPNRFDLPVPDYATQMFIRLDITSLRYTGLSAYGAFWVEYGDDREYSTQDFGFDVNENGGHAYTTNWLLRENRDVPAKYRGRNMRFTICAALDAKNPAGRGQVSLDVRSGINLEVEFREVRV